MTNDLSTTLGFKLLHIGIAVPSLDSATESLSTHFGHKLELVEARAAA